MSQQPNIRVVIRLPYNRPQNALQDPPLITWNSEKANILWEVIAQARASNSGADWNALAEHLEVPLPYLLYRARMKYEEELRGLQEVRGTASPPTNTPAKAQENLPLNPERPAHVRRNSGPTINNSKGTPSARQGTPLGVRARLNSLARQAPVGRPQAALSSSTLTLQGLKKNSLLLRPTSPEDSGESSSEDEVAAKEEAAERANEEQNALTKKLQELKMMMTDDRLGLVQASYMKNKGKQADRPMSNLGTSSARPPVRPSRIDETSSASVSSTSSAQNSGSMPSIPSPPVDYPTSRHISPAQSASPPVLLSPRRPLGPGHSSHRPAPGRRSDSSAHDSPTSSFSDLSDASLSESAFMSNRGDSRISTRSRFVGTRGSRAYFQ